jgi:alanyl-tRNA synthetase
MTERLYYTDSYLCEFAAVVTATEGDTVYLDRTAFYPDSGGQPCDAGRLGGVAVLGVSEQEDGRIAHRLAAPLSAGPVTGAVDWERRFDHMQQHSGQHLLSAVFDERFGLHTVSFHLGSESSTIDVEGGTLDAAGAAEAERLANGLITKNRSVTVRFEDAEVAQGLRKASERQGKLRIVSMEGVDRSACGGTHVRATGEIGVLLIRKLEKIRQSVRVEFVCGARAVRRAGADFEAISQAAQHFSSPIDEVPSQVAVQLEAVRAGEKARRKLELELAAYRGKELYENTAAGADGVRRVSHRLERGSLEDLRALAQNFTAQPKSVFLAALADPPSVLLASSADSGIDAGKILKTTLAEAGGRGGGTARIAQGSVPVAGVLESVLAKLEGLTR